MLRLQNSDSNFLNLFPCKQYLCIQTPQSCAPCWLETKWLNLGLHSTLLLIQILLMKNFVTMTQRSQSAKSHHGYCLKMLPVQPPPCIPLLGQKHNSSCCCWPRSQRTQHTSDSQVHPRGRKSDQEFREDWGMNWGITCLFKPLESLVMSYCISIIYMLLDPAELCMFTYFCFF